MVVGVCRVVLSLPGNQSLKGKRKVVRSVLDRVRARFNVAASEVAENDEWRRAVLGFAVVSNDPSHANSMLDTLLSFVESSVQAVVVDRELEIVHIGQGREALGNVEEDEP